MQSYIAGQFEAVESMIKIAEQGGDFSDIISVIDEEINTPLSKYASEEDVDYARGVHSACFNFMKLANEALATFDIQDEGDVEALTWAILEKVAEEAAEKAEEAPQGRMARARGAVGGAARRAGSVLRNNKGKAIAGAALLTTGGLAYKNRDRLKGVAESLRNRKGKGGVPDAFTQRGPVGLLEYKP
jgi:hypothetical protein